MKTIKPQTAKDLLKLKQMVESANKRVAKTYDSSSIASASKVFVEEAMLIESEFELGFVTDGYGDKIKLHEAFAGYSFVENAAEFAYKVVDHEGDELIAFIALNCPCINCFVVQVYLSKVFSESVKRLGIMDKLFTDMSDDEIEVAMFCRKNS